MSDEHITLIITGITSLVVGAITTRISNKPSLNDSASAHAKNMLDRYEKDYLMVREENHKLQQQVQKLLDENRVLKDTVENLRDEVEKLSQLIRKEHNNAL